MQLSQHQDHDRRAIAQRVRELRKGRGWTQAELAARLDLSQSRLSQVERGDGSFSAEQFLEILRLFNVTTDDFVATSRSDDEVLQNALARLGASHLRESVDILPSQRLREAAELVREVLVSPSSPRLVTSLAPVLVRNIDVLQLPKLRLQLAELGIAQRLGWLIDNTLEAVRHELPHVSRQEAKRYRRAEVVLDAFLSLVTATHGATPQAFNGADVLDATIRSKRTLAEVTSSSSAISRRWGIITSLQLEDFVEALRATHVAD